MLASVQVDCPMRLVQHRISVCADGLVPYRLALTVQVEADFAADDLLCCHSCGSAERTRHVDVACIQVFLGKVYGQVVAVRESERAVLETAQHVRIHVCQIVVASQVLDLDGAQESAVHHRGGSAIPADDGTHVDRHVADHGACVDTVLDDYASCRGTGYQTAQR